MLTDRRRQILQLVVERHLATGRPVGSNALADKAEASPSTIRAELAVLETEGYLTHPHTSAGRVPTETGYRRYAEHLLGDPELLPSAPAGAEITPPAADDDLGTIRREVDEAMQGTLAALGRATDLVALATAPSLATAKIHRVEVLQLQPRAVMVVVITSTGGVAKRVVEFDADVDPGLCQWATSYLHERLAGLAVGARMIVHRLDDPHLDPVERGFIHRLAPAFEGAGPEADADVYVDGTARLLSRERAADLPRIEELVRTLERRASVLAMLRRALDERSVWLWIGTENPEPRLRSASVVGANYGLGWRNLGSVGVVGPLRMDYGRAIASVRGAADELSRYFDTLYEA